MFCKPSLWLGEKPSDGAARNTSKCRLVGVPNCLSDATRRDSSPPADFFAYVCFKRPNQPIPPVPSRQGLAENS